MNAVILAGGKSSRMGTNKAFLELKGKTFIELQIELLSEMFDEIFISANTPSEYEYLNLPVSKDIYPDKGPLGGIYTSLINSGSFHTFMLACDMPFVEPGLIKHLENLTKEYDVVIPKSEKGLEPLHAFYSKKCIDPIKRELDENNLRIISFLPHVNVKIVELNSLPPSASFKNSIKNLNTRDEYEDVTKK
ncbi:MAG: molybdenum cofactor guanylyltransferase [Candidatus Scalindua rubra]|uniref:Probable molybdenum cofactor guanylyltransferase n=1 Tax=Candidatus Scalindua brodae TaxID=237368 RepID=A0A0B0ER24_9BACT|nr:MAG: molybdopterin cofactor biosynthesis protein mobA [Candidatus Scalindua brodae]MBZ0109671.1 molybdenum cofactor guanylyltransferase [Candidatus Scalindua rubra]